MSSKKLILYFTVVLRLFYFSNMCFYFFDYLACVPSSWCCYHYLPEDKNRRKEQQSVNKDNFQKRNGWVFCTSILRQLKHFVPSHLKELTSVARNRQDLKPSAFDLCSFFSASRQDLDTFHLSIHPFFSTYKIHGLYFTRKSWRRMSGLQFIPRSSITLGLCSSKTTSEWLKKGTKFKGSEWPSQIHWQSLQILGCSFRC